MSLVQIRRNFQITLPAKLRKILGIKEGDMVEVDLMGNETIVLKPKAVVEKGRTFTKKQIADWLKEDELDEATDKKAKKLLGVK